MPYNCIGRKTTNMGYRPQPNECTYCRECENIFLFFITTSWQ